MQSTTSTQKNRLGGYSRELEKWLRDSAHLFGEKSNHDALVAAIQRGGSAGCSGTKGVGGRQVRNPFDGWEDFATWMDACDSSRRCARAFAELTSWERTILLARYLFRRDKLPATLFPQLDELSAVAALVAYALGLSERFQADVDRGDAGWMWRDVAAIACEEAHRSFEAGLVVADHELSGSEEEVKS